MIKYILLFLLFSCQPTQFQEKVITNKEEIKFSGTFFIGGQTIKLLRDEDNKVDVITSYVYTKNPDNSDGEFYIAGSNLKIINNKIRWEYSISSTQISSRLDDVIKDDGSSLASVTHLLTVEIDHITTLKLKLILRDNNGNIVVNRSIEEE